MPEAHSPGLFVRTQDPLDFVVQIRSADNKAIVGTGFVISPDGKIVTCAHVVEAVLGVHPAYAGDALLNVRFGCQPWIQADVKDCKANVAVALEDYDDDIAVLQLVGKYPPLDPEKVAILGDANDSRNHKFCSYGYRQLYKFEGGSADGMILLPCPEVLEGVKLLCDMIQLDSKHINFGMSGSPVLDTERNLVVAMISSTHFAEKHGKDRDTAWGINSILLTQTLLRIEYQFTIKIDPVPLRKGPSAPAPEPPLRIPITPYLSPDLRRAPTTLPEWAGRAELLRQLTFDYNGKRIRVAGLIGFGGEGKSSLARQWIDDLLHKGISDKPDGVFWWDFYVRRSFEEFIEVALTYLTDEDAVKRYATTSNRINALISRLSKGRYVIVMDGLEVLQEQHGEKVGSIPSSSLREFLAFFTAEEHESLCLITSRAPLVNLISYSTYRPHDVSRLLKEDGRELLQNLSVKGSDRQLDDLVEKWDGHALTLGLIGTYLRDLFKGDISQVASIPPPTSGDDRYERVTRVLRRYDEQFSSDENAFLKLFSAFRTPVGEKAFGTVFRTVTSKVALNYPLTKLSDREFASLLKRLVGYGILKKDAEVSYTTHPLIRAHYETLLVKEPQSQQTNAHKAMMDYYQSIARQSSEEIPTHEDLKPWIEVVHHACLAGAYDEAYEIYQDRICRGDEFVLSHKLGAYDTELEIGLDFFPDRNPLLDPLVTEIRNKSSVISLVAFNLLHIGRVQESVTLFEGNLSIDVSVSDWVNASIKMQNTADGYGLLGKLDQALSTATRAFEYAEKGDGSAEACYSKAYLGWFHHQMGNFKTSAKYFREAEKLQQKFDQYQRFLYSLRGIQYADHLIRVGKPDLARKVTDNNLVSWALKFRWQKDIGMCHRILGNLVAPLSETEALQHYAEALRIALSISEREVLVQALLARGRFFAKHQKDHQSAFTDLDESLSLSLEGGYRLFEADIRIALAWAHFAAGNSDRARIEANRGKAIGEETGYYWAKVDAAEVLTEIDKPS